MPMTEGVLGRIYCLVEIMSVHSPCRKNRDIPLREGDLAISPEKCYKIVTFHEIAVQLTIFCLTKPRDYCIIKVYNTDTGGRLMTEVMTDFQFKAIIKMVIDIAEATKDAEVITKKLKELISDGDKGEN